MVFDDINFSENDANDESKDLVPLQSISTLAVGSEEEFSEKQNWLNQLNCGINHSFSQLMILQNQIRWSNNEAIRIQAEAIEHYENIIKKSNEYISETQNAYKESMKEINDLKDEIRNLEIKKKELRIEINMLKKQKESYK
ncbi:MAG: hypothetical protein FWB86_11695 [Treponema sp.]|nr:hypothetical protein [Treponema sp.]